MRQLLPLSSLLLASFILVLGTGVTGLLVPTRAAAEGWSTDVIAAMGASHALFFTLGCVLVPRLVARVGHIRVFGALGTLSVASLLLHALEPTAWFWVLVRGLAGFSLAGSYMILESWLNEATDNHNRGVTFSVYMVISLGGQALGPFLVTLGDVRGFELFAIAALVYAAATLPITLTAARAPAPLTRVSLDLGALYRNSPAAFVGSVVTGAVAGAWASLVPVYGAAIGLTTAGVALFLAVGNLGSMAFQLPIGRLSDRVDRRWVMVGVGVLGVVAGAVLATGLVGGTLAGTPGGTVPGRPDNWTLIALAFVFGGALYTTYSLNVAHANDWAVGVSFVTVASGLLILYGAGSTLGPLVAGRLMAVMGPEGLFAFTAGAHLVYAGFALWRISRRGNVPNDDQIDFRSLPVTRSTTPQTFELDVRADEGGAETFANADPDYAVAGEA